MATIVTIENEVVIRQATWNDTGSDFLSVNKDSRDSIVAANAFLTILQDNCQDVDTKIRIGRVISHLSDMLYGFDEET